MKRRIQLTLAVLIAGGAMTWLRREAKGTECGPSSNTLWSIANDGSEVAGIASGVSNIYWTLGSRIRAATHTASLSTWERDFETIVPGEPLDFTSESGTEALVVAGSDGIVYRLDPDTLTNLWSRSTRRGSISTDSIIAPLAVQRRSQSDSNFQSAVDSDLVFTATAYAVTTTLNRIYALRATDGSIVWVHNSTGTYQYDRFRGLAVDHARNSVYAAITEDAPTSSQHTIVALNSMTGARRWARDLGSIEARPVLADDGLFVATKDGMLYKLDPGTGNTLWQETVASHGASVTRDITVETVGTRSLIFVTDTSGRLRCCLDACTLGAVIWVTDLAGEGVTTTAIAMPQAQKVFVGGWSGRVYQLNATTGESEAFASLGGISEPGLHVLLTRSHMTSTYSNRLATVSPFSTRYLCVPWQAGNSPRDFVPASSGCSDPLAPSSGLLLTASSLSSTSWVGQAVTRQLTVSKSGCYDYQCVCLDAVAPPGLGFMAVTSTNALVTSDGMRFRAQPLGALPMQVSVTFTSAAPGLYEIPLTVSNGQHLHATLTLTNRALVNELPVVANAIPDRTNYYGQPFAFTFAANTFSDPGQALAYTASNLPPGISFDGPSRMFGGTNTDVGEWLVTVTATDNGLPSLSTNATFQFAVGKAPLLAIVGNTNRPYGQFNPWFTLTYSGFVPGEGEFVLDSPPFAGSDASISSGVGTYPVQAVWGFDDHYEVISVDGVLAVTPVPLTVVAGDFCRAVGEANPPLTGALLGRVDYDFFNHVMVVTGATPATAASPVGVYPVVPGLIDPDQRATNYIVSYVTGSLQVVSAAMPYETLRSFGFTNLMGSSPRGRLVEGSNSVAYGVAPPGPELFGVEDKGMIYRVNLAGGGYQVLHAFRGGPGDGENPAGTLLLAGDGWLYGTTLMGGVSNQGTVFRLRTDGTDFSVLRSFSNADPGGVSPNSLAEGTNGLLYGTSGGGQFLQGVIWSMQRDGTGFTVLRDAAIEADGYNPFRLVAGLDGVLYGAMQDAGPGFAGTLFRMNTDGSGFTVLQALNFSSTGSGPTDLIEGSDGFLYATMFFSGPNFQGVLARLAKDGSSYTLLHSFNDGPTDGLYPNGLAEGTNGLLYGTTQTGGGGGTVYQVNRDGTGYQVLWRFTPATNNVAEPSGGLLAASDGRLYGGARSSGGLAYRRVLWGLSTDGTGFSELHEFSITGRDGRNPQGVLALGADGRLYGTTYEGGGAAGRGAVFAIQPDGSGYEVLHRFAGDTEFPPATPGNPLGGVVQGLDGALYGVTESGGTNNSAGTIYRLQTNGTGFTVLHHFDNSTFLRGWLVSGLTVGSNGVLFGISGGNFAPGTLFRLNPDGTEFAFLREFAGPPADGFGPNAKLLPGSDGALYGTTISGGTHDRGTVFKIEQDGTGYSVLHHFDGTNGAYCYAGLSEADDGRLYGTALLGGQWDSGVVFGLNRDGTGFAVLAHTSPANGRGSQFGVAQGPDGALYGVTDGLGASSGVLFRVSAAGGDFCVLHQFGYAAGDGAYPYSPLLRGLDGTLFGTCSFGGVSGFGTIFKLSGPGNQPPALVNAIPNQSATYGTPFGFVFAANTFNEPDAGQSLGYAASNLPPGIAFDGPTRTFSGTPAATGSFAVTVTATDNGTPPASASTMFELAVARAALVVTASNTTRTFGQPDPPLTGSLEGVVNGDDITANFYTDALLHSPPGVHAILVSLNDPNGRLVHYSVTTNFGVLTITCPPVLTVTSLADDGPGTLREALAVVCEGGAIQFGVTGTITLTSEQLEVGKSVSLLGPGATNLAVSGGNQWRVFNVTTGTALISGLTIAQGSDSAIFLVGAGVRNNANLRIVECRFTGNVSESAGGAIFNRPDGVLVVERCLFDGNRALGAFQGGGVGGAIANQGVLRATNCTFSGNSAGFTGGALRNAGDLVVESCTFTRNTASECIDCEGTPAVLIHVGTFAALHNTIVGGNTNALGAHRDMTGGFDTGDYNLIEMPTGFALPGTNNLPGVPPLLGPLADHGGPTFVHLPQPGSPAIDTADPLEFPAADQRGVARPFSGRADIGAVESPFTVTVPTLSIELLPGGAVRVFWTRPAEGFVLEEVAAITSSPVTGWSLVPPANYQTNATHVSITLPMPTGMRVYRLRPQ